MTNIGKAFSKFRKDKISLTKEDAHGHWFVIRQSELDQLKEEKDRQKRRGDYYQELSITRSSDIGDLVRKLARKDEIIEELKKIPVQMGIPKIEYERVKIELGIAETVNQELITENRELKSRNRGLEFEIGELEILKRENQKLKTENQELKNRYHEFENRISKIEKAKTEKAEPKMSLEEWELRDRHADLKGEEWNLRQQLKALDEELKTIEDARGYIRCTPHLKELLKQSAKDLHRVKAERYRLEEKLKEVRREILLIRHQLGC